MNQHFQSLILERTGASALAGKVEIQELWSGYGKIIRVALQDAAVPSVVVKLVQIPGKQNHPRGWNTEISHQRKLKSYQVETNWYRSFSEKSAARLPHCLAIGKQNGNVLIVLEDLDAAGYPLRKESLSWPEMKPCLAWLAQFHASYLGVEPEDLWEQGTYWHLATRPQELKALKDQKLKEAASLIDSKLKACSYKTLLHGDAKLANFCFSEKGAVAAVDFQYVGGGCGMKDLAYFVGSCLSESYCERLEGQILDVYFEYLQMALPQKNEALEAEWRSLYHLAWADFHRFLKGWSPGHWKINSYSERVTREAISKL